MLTVTFLSLATILLAMVSIAAIALVVGFASRWPGRLFQYLMFAIVIASVGTIMLSGRVLTLGVAGLSTGADADGGGGLWGKVLLAGVIGCAVSASVGWFILSRKRRRALSRFAPRRQKQPTDIVLAFLAYYVAFSLFPLLFAPIFDFHVSLVYPFFVFLALLLWSQASSVDPVVVAKQCMGLIVLGSLIAALVMPGLATQPGYLSLIPGFNSRLWGVTASANSLGSVACMLLVLEVAEPSKRRWMRLAVQCLSVLALVMAQSKTSIVAGAVGVGVVYSWRSVEAVLAAKGRHIQRGLPLAAGGIALVAVFMCAAGFWLMFSDSSVLPSLERRLDARAVGSLATASGRTLIWHVAIEGGLANPLFGQGLAFWSLENRLHTGLNGAVHAHNLFLQVFSRSGIVGLAAFLFFLWLLVLYSVRAARVTRGGSIGLMVVFLMRAMVEVPLQPNSVLGAEFFALVAYLFYVIDRGAKPVTLGRSASTTAASGNFAVRSAVRRGAGP